MKKEYCSSNSHIKYAGTHLIIELWDGKNFSSLLRIKKILEDAVKACGATLLKINLHKFSSSGGISGAALLKESHISIHTWPEYKYAAMDIFVCGSVNPYDAIDVIKKGFTAKNIQIAELKRGIF
ncbi:MAG: adenosylmethionine decarboxylase [Candidatus Omnitrophota bacterium]|nr:MAG: adenosylmethionine decarboxylase [Candidatus Omnitrophota bacterium]